jgi:hypothetical protein
VDSSPPPEPDSNEVTRIAGEIGEIVAHLSPPPPNWGTLMVVYGALYLGLCKELKANPYTILSYIHRRYEMGIEEVHLQ